MSGGHFNYNQYKLEEIADSIDRLIDSNSEKDEYGYSNDYSEKTLDKLKITAQRCRDAGKMAQRVDWLVSGDDGEDNFHKRWEEEGLK